MRISQKRNSHGSRYKFDRLNSIFSSTEWNKIKSAINVEEESKEVKGPMIEHSSIWEIAYSVMDILDTSKQPHEEQIKIYQYLDQNKDGQFNDIWEFLSEMVGSDENALVNKFAKEVSDLMHQDRGILQKFWESLASKPSEQSENEEKIKSYLYSLRHVNLEKDDTQNSYMPKEIKSKKYIDPKTYLHALYMMDKVLEEIDELFPTDIWLTSLYKSALAKKILNAVYNSKENFEFKKDDDEHIKFKYPAAQVLEIIQDNYKVIF